MFAISIAFALLPCLLCKVLLADCIGSLAADFCSLFPSLAVLFFVMPTTRGTNNSLAAGLDPSPQTSSSAELPVSVNTPIVNSSSATIPYSSSNPASTPDVPSPAFVASVVQL